MTTAIRDFIIERLNHGDKAEQVYKAACERFPDVRVDWNEVLQITREYRYWRSQEAS